MVDSLVEDVGRAARWRVSVAFAVAAGCYLLLFALGSRLLNDPDTYWQIALGDWIVAHGTVPHTDTFSWSMAGAPWISSQWLAQVLFAQAFAIAGWVGVVVLSAIAAAVAIGLLTRFLLERLATGPAVALSMAGFVLVSPHLLARAHVLALPLMVAWIAGLMRAREQDRAPSLRLLPLMALWANLHGGFTFGLVFIAPLALEALWTAPPQRRVDVALRWGGFAAAAAVAACMTPYGPESILVTRRILDLGRALALIGEWRPQDFAMLGGFELCLLLGIGFALYRGLTLPPIRIALLLGLLHMALLHSRYGELLGLLAPLVVALPLAPQLGRPRAEPGEALRAAWPAVLALTLALGAVTAAIAYERGYRPDPRITPARAVAALKASGKTHVLNGYEFGGYLIAAGVAPYIDGRTELYGESFFMRHDRMLKLEDVDELLRVLHDDRVDATLLAPGTPAIGLFDHLKGWTRLYADDIAVVHVRTAPASANAEQLQ
jgi:hypothetical protein